MLQPQLKDNFRFFIPAEIEKGKNSKGEEVYKIKGRASTSSRDSQGETLDPTGFDLTDFKTINWNHKSKDDASAYIGEPTKAIVGKSGIMDIEGELYNEMPMTASVVSLMKALKKRGKQLGMSIEGKVIERDMFDKKKVLKAKITGVAITPNPINSDTFVGLIEKGETQIIDWTYDSETEELMKAVDEGKVIEDEIKCPTCDVALKDNKCPSCGYIHKAMTAANTAILAKESVEHDPKDETGNKKSLLKKLSKADVYEEIFSYFHSRNQTVNLSTAKEIYKFVDQMAGQKEITPDTLKKAFEILEIASDELNKSAAVTELTLEKAIASATIMKGEGKSKEEISSKLKEDGYKDEDVQKAVSEVIKDAEDNKNGGDITVLRKSFDTFTEVYNKNNKKTDDKFAAIADLFKDMSEHIVALTEELASVKGTVEKSATDIEAIGTVANRKSIGAAGFAEKNFNGEIRKSESGAAVYNLNNRQHKKFLKDKLVQLSGVNKDKNNYNVDILKAAQDIELGFGITNSAIVELLKGEKIEVVLE